MRDHVAWHDAYGEPGSPLWQRLQVVRSLIGAVLDAAPAGPVRFVSLCAGRRALDCSGAIWALRLHPVIAMPSWKSRARRARVT